MTTTLTFFMINLSAGDTALAVIGGAESLPAPEVLARVRAEHGLDQPLHRQYAAYPGRLVQGDLGESFRLHWFAAPGSNGWTSMVLPTLTLALPLPAVLTQVLRQELEDILGQPFITMARAHGMSDAAVRLRHAWRHALIPLVTLSGFIFAGLFGGAVIAETLFARHGVGRLMFEATSNKDIPLVLGITLLATVSYVIINLIVDVIYVLVDPRVTTA